MAQARQRSKAPPRTKIGAGRLGENEQGSDSAGPRAGFVKNIAMLPLKDNPKLQEQIRKIYSEFP